MFFYFFILQTDSFIPYYVKEGWAAIRTDDGGGGSVCVNMVFSWPMCATCLRQIEVNIAWKIVNCLCPSFSGIKLYINRRIASSVKKCCHNFFDVSCSKVLWVCSLIKLIRLSNCGVNQSRWLTGSPR